MNETQQKLIMVTERLLRTNGLARLTTRMIAGEAGVAEGLIYHYFSDKAGLIHEVIEQRINDVRNAMEKLPSLIGLNTVTDNLEKVMIVTYSVQYRMTPLMNSVFADSKVRERIREIADVKQMGPDKETENLAVYISAEQRLGRINCDIDSASAARLLLANCFMSATHDQFLGLDPDRKEVKKDIRSAIQTLMRGLEPGSKRIQKKPKAGAKC
jgi:AcrR family transcriptional regulator